MSTKTTVWGIHANPGVDAQDLFRKEGVIAIGWPEVGDLSALKASRAAFKAAMQRTYPDAKAGALPVQAGVLYRFVHEMKVGDVVIHPSKHDRQVNIGLVEGEYEHAPERESHNPNRRRVSWKQTLPRTHFSQGALYEIGSALTLFQVKNFAEEFLNALRGEVPPVVEDDDGGTIGQVVHQIEETTRDHIVKTLTTHAKGHGLAALVGHLLECMGYRARVAPPGPDRGVDIVAHKDALGFEPPIIKVQVKSSEQNVGNHDVSALYGQVDQDEYGLFVSMGSYTSQAKAFAHNKNNLRLIDGQELINLILEHYDRFDMHYKALIPLKRVYIPDQGREES